MAPEDSDKAFDRAVTNYINEGLHTRRDLTTDEYIALCRKAWDASETSPKFPFKVLIDPLQSAESLLANNTQEYVHWRAADLLEASREPSTDIRCETIAAVGPDFSTDPNESTSGPTEESETPETRRYILAVFDVLGFSALLH